MDEYSTASISYQEWLETQSRLAELEEQIEQLKALIERIQPNNKDNVSK